jgi:chromate reductase, NAD(P)H dehydrogenase (quinone)
MRRSKNARPFRNACRVARVRICQPAANERSVARAPFAVPEYNFSVPGVLKNALEWLSRPPDSPTNGKPCAVFGASVSPLGTARGQFHFRHICVSLNMILVNTPHVDITNAKTKFDAEGMLVDQASVDLIRQLVGELRNLTNRLCDTQSVSQTRR